MSENAYGARSGDGNEGGTSPISDQQASVPQGSQPGEQEPQGSEQGITPQYLKEMEQRILEEATKRAQSMTDKLGSRMNKEIESALAEANQAIELMKSAGVPYTAEQEQKIKEKAVNKAYMKAGQEPTQSPPQSSGQQEPGIQKNDPWVWVNQKVHQLMDSTGVHISPKEANEMIVGDRDPATIDPYDYMKAFEGLIEQRQQNIRQPQGLNPAVPSYVTGGRSTRSKSALQTEYDQQVNLIKQGKHPTIVRGDQMGIMKLKNAYREKGLDI